MEGVTSFRTNDNSLRGQSSQVPTITKGIIIHELLQFSSVEPSLQGPYLVGTHPRENEAGYNHACARSHRIQRTKAVSWSPVQVGTWLSLNLNLEFFFLSRNLEFEGKNTRRSDPKKTHLA